MTARTQAKSFVFRSHFCRCQNFRMTSKSEMKWSSNEANKMPASKLTETKAFCVLRYFRLKYQMLLPCNYCRKNVECYRFERRTINNVKFSNVITLRETERQNKSFLFYWLWNVQRGGMRNGKTNEWDVFNLLILHAVDNKARNQFYVDFN